MEPTCQRCLTWVILLFITVVVGSGCSELELEIQPTPSSPEVSLIALEDLVNRIRDDQPVKVEKGIQVTVRENDSISIVDPGRGELRFPDGLVVELLDQTDISLDNVHLELPNLDALVVLRLSNGHIQAKLQEEANARLTIETKYATITATEAGTNFLLCHADEVLTCLVTLEGETEIEAQGKVMTVRSPQGAYIFPGQPPTGPICADVEAVKQWLDDKRGTETVKALGDLVAGWPQEPCSGTTPTPPLADLPSSQGMVKIAQAAYQIGRLEADDFHIAAQEIALDEFWIDQYEVTNAQYQVFLNKTGHPPPATWPGEESHPVKGITWDDGVAYCAWAKKRLPGEAEWEVAARGPESRLYPWGDNPEAVQLPQSGTYPVGSKLTNQTPFGIFDMAGNVWEWVGEPYAPIAEGNRMLRGGANDLLKDMAYRLQGNPTVATTIASAGFRCAADQVVVERPVPVADDSHYQDNFAEPGSGWPIKAEGIFFFGYHPPDFYHVEVGTANNYTVVSQPIAADNATLETEVLVDHTATANGNFRYGLALRRIGADQFYAFTISPRTGAWHALKRSLSGLEVLAEGQVDSLRGFAPPGFTPNETDILRVDANGPDFFFHINGQFVDQVRDVDYATGEVGFFVENFDETLAHIHYDSLTIREVELPSSRGDSIPTTTPERLCAVIPPALNLRSGPGTVYAPIVTLTNGISLEPLARDNEGMWIQVRVVESGQMGWINAESTYVSCNVPVTDLPVG